MSNNIFFISATNTDVGKTYTTIKLIEALSNINLKAIALKPIETGVGDMPLDASLLLQKINFFNKIHLNIYDICFFTFRAPATPEIARNGVTIDLEYIKRKILNFSKEYDVVLVEGAGGLLSPIYEDKFIIDLMKETKSKNILVSPSNLGCINDTLLSRYFLDKNDLQYISVVNLYKNIDDFYDISWPYLKKLSNIFVLQKDMDKILEFFK